MQKRTFYVQEGRIRTLCHYAPLKVTRVAKTHLKDRSQQDGEPPKKSDEDAGDEEASLQAVLAAERDCLAAVRRSQLEVIDLLRLRRREETSVAVDVPVFEAARGRRADDRAAQQASVADASSSKDQVDYLTPFLQNVDDLQNARVPRGDSSRSEPDASPREQTLSSTPAEARVLPRRPPGKRTRRRSRTTRRSGRGTRASSRSRSASSSAPTSS